MCYTKCKKSENHAKAVRLEARICRYSNGQSSLLDFKLPVGMNLKESNRRVKKAQMIPWTEIERWYAALFTNRKGNVVRPLCLELGDYIVQAEYGLTEVIRRNADSEKEGT